MSVPPDIHKKYLFIDESGDPVFYGSRKKLLVGTEGFQPYLIIGMIETSDRKALRKAVVGFMDNIKTDRLYNSIPSVNAAKGWFVHLYLSQRGNNSLHRFQIAVDKALAAKESNARGIVNCNLEIVPGKQMPELSIVDYLMWAVQRKLLTGESRYFDALQDKYETVLNLYDSEEK